LPRKAGSATAPNDLTQHRERDTRQRTGLDAKAIEESHKPDTRSLSRSP
jgi:hypothetical protein